MSVRTYAVCYIWLFTILISFISPEEGRTQNCDSIDRQSSTSISNSRALRLNRLKANTNKNTVTIVMGGGSDTQIRIVQDMADILNNKDRNGKQKLRIVPIMGQGGAQNALDVMFLRGVDIGITQTDILAHLRGENAVLYKNIFQRVHYITKLYNAEWHVIGKQKFKNISDLKGKRVNISKVNSGTYITSKNIFELLGIKVKYATYNNSVAIEKMRRRELDAVVIMGGAPIDGIQKISREEGYHFIPATFFYEDYFKAPLKNVLELFYLPTTLKHEQYPNLIAKGQSVPTVANSIVLAVYNWPNKSPRELRVAQFVNEFFRNIKKFRDIGRHSKWKEINLTARVPEWNRANIAELVLRDTQGSKATSISGNQTDKRYQKFLSFMQKNGNLNVSDLSPQQKQALYKQFLNFIERK